VGTAVERLAVPPGVLPHAGGLSVQLSSTAMVGLGESARYLDEYPYDCAEQRASRALALLVASTVGDAFTLSGINPPGYRAEAARALAGLRRYQCRDGSFALWAGQCGSQSAYLTAYVLHVMKVAGTLKVAVDDEAIERALDYLERQMKAAPPKEIQWWPVWGASQAYSAKVLAEFGRKPTAAINRLVQAADRLPVFALSYLADALAASHDRGPRYQRVITRVTNALRTDADRAHVEEVDEDALAWLWNSTVRATAVVLEGLSRRRDDITFVAPLARWLVAARTKGRWGTTHENAMALEALSAHFRALEPDVPHMTATVSLDATTVGQATFNGRSTAARPIDVSMANLVAHVGSAESARLSIARKGTGRLYYTARLQYLAPEPHEALERGFRVERSYELFMANERRPSTTFFRAGDLIRVSVVLTLRGEGRYLALTDPLPAGFEPLDGSLTTTSTDVELTSNPPWWQQWRAGSFDHVEKHDNRVVAFATRLEAGRHEFSYLVRATTAGTFDAAGARVEAMYAPEVTGRSEAATVNVRSLAADEPR
jgi:uncharacterized protein YfaS (alpha-2-macroglobulin family)